MASGAFSREEGLGLAVSIVGHAALLAVLLYRAPAGDVVTPPQRIEVTFADDVGLVSASPEPSRAAQASVAPTMGAQSPAEFIENIPLPMPVPVPAPVAAPRASPVTAARSAPAGRRSRAAPDPVADAISRSSRTPSRRSSDTRPRRRPDRETSATATPSSRPSGGSRVGSDFLSGSNTADTSGRSSSPRAAITGRVLASLQSAMARQIKPHWTVPQGADAEKLVTLLSWDLNPDGSLKGSPRVEGQLGVNDANSAQAPIHAERAIRAVRSAAPFNLPGEYYEAWKSPRKIRFDRNL